jgi:Tfp pilus assembly protein PilV
MRSCTKGFTLVETIFSTLFISLTVLAIVNLFPGAYMSVKKSETRLQSDMIAQSIIEDLRSMNFQALTPGDEPTYDPVTLDGIEYAPTVTVQNLAGMDPTVVKGVSVEIIYRVGTLEQKNLHETYLHSLNQ